MGKSLHMESTQIEPGKTAAEVAELLGVAGAREVLTEYDDKRRITGIAFAMLVDGQRVPFQMPIRSDSIFKILNGRRPPITRHKCEQQDRQQADRVAWRIALRWLQAQVAYIETGMVKTEEVFLPYIAMGRGQTLYQFAAARGLHRMALPAPEGTHEKH